ncbi:MAG: GNAT family N-acetyltransferase [Oscillospiraceae bacterium]
MTIRQMLPQDDGEVCRMYVKSWQTGYKGLLPQEYLDSLSPERWRGRFTGLPGSFVITDGETIVGHSCARPAADENMSGWGEVWTLYVLPEYWGRGYGRALLENSVSWLNEQGFDRVYLWALDSNTRARRFYEHCGFCETQDALECDIAGITVTDIRYVRGQLWQK